ncbi:glycosyltransferase 87 family protein [Actinomadura flavalba]|uniref:glycosyltransferase 87 family protein n=1 Tax=Actinomadura flavalba TaxID=1120938 RepID=UPI00036F0BF5|nr:glycosyltransferase 87 family protein [Actinomadura flavalba]
MLYGGFAVFAAVTALVTSLPPHRLWGAIAAPVYLLAAIAAYTPWGRSRAATVAALTAVGTLLAPLGVLTVTGSGQPEVEVVHRSGALLMEHGSPYLHGTDLSGYLAYNPYFPGMALFGVPHALLGLDARWLFTLVTLAALTALVRRRDAALIAASPLLALALAVGGDDLPVLALMGVGVVLAGQGRGVPAALVVGVAALLKATAWPALAVAFVLVAAVGGRRELRRFVLGAGFMLLVLAGAVLADLPGFMENAIRFPLGLAGVDSPASSPLPGRLLADLGPHGHTAAVVLLGAAAFAMAVWLVVKPPRTTGDALLRLALGLLVAAALMPATRWGYLVYAAVLGWLAHLRGGVRWAAS